MIGPISTSGERPEGCGTVVGLGTPMTPRRHPNTASRAYLPFSHSRKRYNWRPKVCLYQMEHFQSELAKVPGVALLNPVLARRGARSFRGAFKEGHLGDVLSHSL